MCPLRAFLISLQRALRETNVEIGTPTVVEEKETSAPGPKAPAKK